MMCEGLIGVFFTRVDGKEDVALRAERGGGGRGHQGKCIFALVFRHARLPP